MYALYGNSDTDGMAEEVQQRFIGVALIGLLYIAFGIIMLFAFIAVITGKGLPDFLEFKSETYNLLLMGLVNIAAAVGLLYRKKGMWSVTMVFLAVIIIGDLMDLFFTGTAKLAVFFIYLAILLYMMSREVRVWYGVK